MSDWMFAVLSTMKENIDLLTGNRGSGSATQAAISAAQITVQPAPAMGLTKMSATGAGFTINGVRVASLDDHIALIQDVRTLAVDVANLHATVNALIAQLKG
jgi:hypothetical protein